MLLLSSIIRFPADNAHLTFTHVNSIKTPLPRPLNGSGKTTNLSVVVAAVPLGPRSNLLFILHREAIIRLFAQKAMNYKCNEVLVFCGLSGKTQRSSTNKTSVIHSGTLRTWQSSTRFTLSHQQGSAPVQVLEPNLEISLDQIKTNNSR